MVNETIYVMKLYGQCVKRERFTFIVCRSKSNDPLKQQRVQS